MLWRFVIIGATLLTLAQATPPRTSRQNFYNYRTDFDDDQNYAQFEGDTNGNFASEFGQKVGARASGDLDQQEEILDYTDSVIPANDDEEPLPSDGRRLKTTWTDSSSAGDPSYSFGYDLSDQSRHETSDSFGNVNGVYSYIDDEGVYRHVSYSAGPGTGFVVHNKHESRVRPPYIRGPNIPESPKVHRIRPTQWEEEEQVYPIGPTRPTINEIQQRPWSPPRRRKPAYVVKIRRPVKQDPGWAYFRPPNPSRLAPPRGSGGWTAPIKPQRPPVKVYPQEESYDGGWTEPDQGSSYPKDASYSFAYDAGDHNRHEVSDPWGNVRGSYSYIDPDGVRRTVHYSASSATGFKILKASPSNQISTVYREPKPSQPRLRPKQPSAFVYHLHPDGGWKPWEASNSRIPQSPKEKPRRPYNSVSQSYHYQSQTIGRKEDQENRQRIEQTLLTPVAKRQRRPQAKSVKLNAEEPHDQQYSDSDYEIQELAEARFEPQRRGKSSDPAETKTEIRGYRGGYGDKNPLLVVSESSTRPRTVGPETNDEDDKQTNQPGNENQEKRQISIAKMMSMRMSSSQKKSKSSARKSENDNGPTMMSNSGRLMHYPKSRSGSNSQGANE